MKISRETRRILLESALIVFSILLALGLDAWWETRRDNARVEAARAAFVQEIRGNLELLEDGPYHAYHRDMWQAYRVLGAIEEPSAQDVEQVSERFANGVHPTPFRDAVWRSLSNTDLMGRLPFEEVFIIADIYREQDNVDGWHQRMFDVWSEARSDREDPAYIRDDIERMRSYLSDVVAGEERLLRQYAEALEILTGKSPQP